MEYKLNYIYLCSVLQGVQSASASDEAEWFPVASRTMEVVRGNLVSAWRRAKEKTKRPKILAREVSSLDFPRVFSWWLYRRQLHEVVRRVPRCDKDGWIWCSTAKK